MLALPANRSAKFVDVKRVKVRLGEKRLDRRLGRGTIQPNLQDKINAGTRRRKKVDGKRNSIKRSHLSVMVCR